MPDRNLLVFAAAGASKAVNRDKFPTTVEFFQQLPSEITNNTFFLYVHKYLTNIEKIEIIDIEQILWSLKNLSNFYGSIKSPSDIVGFAIHNGLTARIVNGGNDGNLPGSAHNLKLSVDNLISEINEKVYQLYAYEPDESELADNWIALLNSITKSKLAFDIFSTNYDAIIECALGFAYTEKDSRSFQGIKGIQRKELDLKRWTEKSSDKNGLLTKLHGSIDWKIQSNHIYVGDAIFTGDHDKHAIVYPGFKGRSDIEFFREFHDYFEEKLSSATHLLFIGFAFRDEYINQIIRENISTDAQVIVVNPDKSVKFPALRHRNLKYLHEYFDLSSVVSITNLFKI
jgi:hypothetical protein